MAPKKILIVEDEVLIGMMIRKKLTARGYEVSDLVTTGEDAVVQAMLWNPDVIIMDIVLAEKMTGIDAAREIRTKSSVPIVFFSGNNRDKTLIEQARDLSSVEIVNKLGSPEELYTGINDALAEKN